MRVNHGSRLRLAHQHLYQKVVCHEPGLTIWQKAKRLFLLVFGAALVALLTPFIPSRRHNDTIPLTMEEYAPKLLYSGLFAVVALGYGVYELLIKPARNRYSSYQWIGRFPVRAKQQVLMTTWLEFAPDDTHQVEVDRQLYNKIALGDIVEIIYSSHTAPLSVRRITA